MEALWQFDFSEHCGRQLSGAADADVAAGVAAGTEGAGRKRRGVAESPAFSFAGKVWRLRCFENHNADPPAAAAHTFDLKLVRVSCAQEGVQQPLLREMTPAGLPNSVHVQVGPCPSPRHQGAPLALECEFRLRGSMLLGRPILRKLYADVEVLASRGVLDKQEEGNASVSAGEQEEGEGEGEEGDLFGPDRHAIDGRMLEKFLRHDQLIVSVLMVVKGQHGESVR
jgi:hypothetical protein